MRNLTNAYTEVYVVLQDLMEEDYNKIPAELIDAIEEKRNKDYDFELNKDVELKEQDLLPESKAILFNLFRDYLSTPEQREKIIKMQAKEREKIEQKKKEKYSSDVFAKDNNKDSQPVILKSNLIKYSMGFMEFPVDDNSGVSYNLRLDGSKMSDKKAFILEKQDLEDVISDLNNIEKYCNISGVNIKNVVINDGKNLHVLANIVKKIRRINVENSMIPGLASMVKKIDDKEKVELINIVDSGIKAKDIDSSVFKNIYSFVIENTNIGDDALPAVCVSYPWYKRVWNKIKKWPIFNVF